MILNHKLNHESVILNFYKQSNRQFWTVKSSVLNRRTVNFKPWSDLILKHKKQAFLIRCKWEVSWGIYHERLQMQGAEEQSAISIWQQLLKAVSDGAYKMRNQVTCILLFFCFSPFMFCLFCNLVPDKGCYMVTNPGGARLGAAESMRVALSFNGQCKTWHLPWDLKRILLLKISRNTKQV